MADDDVQIEVGGAVRRHITKRVSPLSDPGKVVVPYDSPDEDPMPVFISEEVMKAIERHSLSDKEREIGGVLLGGFYRNDDGSFVEVTDFIEAERAKATDISLTFTHEAWERIHERIALRGDGIQIVGWYHSHPGLGVFMSKEDEFIHSSYFSDPWHVAIVHDPIYTNWGCFKWSDGKLDRTGGFHVFTEKGRARRIREYVKGQLANRQAAPRSASASAGRAVPSASVSQAPLWAAIVVLLAIQLGTLAWMAFSRGSATPEAGEYKLATECLRTSDLSGAAEHLKAALRSNPADDLAYRDLRKLHRVLADPKVASDAFDRQNALLAAADKMAKDGGAGTAAVGLAKDGAADYAGSDGARKALEAYSSAAATRADRVRRAEAVDSMLSITVNGKRQHVPWAKAAVDWLKTEQKREDDCRLPSERPEKKAGAAR